MNSNHFVHDRLGKLSSHPQWIKWRQSWFAVAAFVPLGILVLLLLVVLLNSARWLDAIRHTADWATVVGACLSFALGILMTVTLCARVALWQKFKGIALPGQSARLPAEPLLILVALAIGAIGPFVLSRVPSIDPALRFAFQAFAVVPLAGVLLGTIAMKTGEPGEAAGVKRPVWMLLLWLLIGLYGLTLLRDLGLRFAGIQWFFHRYLPWYRPFTGAALLVPLCFVVYAMWHLWRSAVTTPGPTQTPCPDPASGVVPQRRSLWRRIVDWLLGRGTYDDTSPDTTPKAPQWLQGLLDALNFSDAKVRRTESEGDNFSPLDAQGVYSTILGGLIPTHDQGAALRAFCQRYEQLLRGTSEKEEATAVEPVADLLLHGQTASGRTTVLLGCAILAAFVRGQRVLLIAPNSERQKLLLQRLDQTVKRLRLDSYVLCSFVNERNVRQWVTETQALPHILIGTPLAVEQSLYGLRCDTLEMGEKLRRLLLLLDVILIDDLTEVEPFQCSHLPFLIDRQRLLLAGEYLPLQVLITTRLLAPLGEEVLGRRLFTRRFRPENVLRLRPRRGVKSWSVRIDAENVHQTRDTLIHECLERGMKIVLYCPGIKEAERILMGSHSVSSTGGKLEIIGGLDEPLTVLESQHVDVIIHLIDLLEPDPSLALRFHAGHDQTVIFGIGRRGEYAEPLLGAVPITTERTAQGYLVQHLNTAGAYLRRFSPIPSYMWAQFGLDRTTPAIEPLAPGQVFASRPMLLVDESREQLADDAVWPYLCLREPVWPAVHSDIARVPPPGLVLCRDAAGMHIVVAEAKYPGDLAPSAHQIDWQIDGAALPAMDPIHLLEFRQSLGAGVFVPHSIGVDASGQPLVTAGRWRGDGHDLYLPVMELEWQLPSEALPQLCLEVGAAHGIALVRFDAPVKVACRFVSVFSEAGDETPISPIDAHYPAMLSCIMFNPKPHLDIASLKCALTGEWTSMRESFRPSLTAAMNYAFESRLPGSRFFARVLAFVLEGPEAPAEAVAWIIEPCDTGCTLTSALQPLLRDQAERRSFLKAMNWMLQMLQERGVPLALQRRLARIGHSADATHSDRYDSLELVRSILNRSENPLDPPPTRDPDEEDARRMNIQPPVNLGEPQ